MRKGQIIVLTIAVFLLGGMFGTLITSSLDDSERLSAHPAFAVYAGTKALTYFSSPKACETLSAVNTAYPHIVCLKVEDFSTAHAAPEPIESEQYKQLKTALCASFEWRDAIECQDERIKGWMTWPNGLSYQNLDVQPQPVLPLNVPPSTFDTCSDAVDEQGHYKVCQ